jgi:choline dehydrogenase-like flavoprotein
VLGCAHGAKWTALSYLEEAAGNGAAVQYEAKVDRVIVEGGTARGVEGTVGGKETKISARKVIIAAGGLGTPVILQNSGIKEAGGNLFIDIQVHTYGATDGLNQIHEPQMALVDLDFHTERGFLLSPFVNHPRQVRLLEAEVKGFALPTTKIIGLMTKIADAPSGRVYPDGSIEKTVTAADREKISRGMAMAREILARAGANPRSFVDSNPAGSHAGGTAAIGQVVDAALQTKVDNLFVCDASVLPQAPGLPPILTIVALAKRLGKTLD